MKGKDKNKEIKEILNELWLMKVRGTIYWDEAEYKLNKLIPLKQSENVVLDGVSNRPKTKRVSSDGVFFRCDNCGHEPQMKSDTDDLLQMHFCPKCGGEFE